VEGAVATLFRRGVYLTVDEFKGRRPLRRGSLTLELDPVRLRNPLAVTHVSAESGGSRGAPTPAFIDLAFIRERAITTGLVHHARNGARWKNAVWKVPGGIAVVRVLEFSAIGAAPVRWFAQVDTAAPGLHSGYRWTSRAMRAVGFLAGVPLPIPRHVSLDDPLPIARWMAETTRAGATPHLHTTPSAAVRLCQAALQAGVELQGTEFTLASEATTAVRLAVVQSTGAHAQPCYAASECGPIGYGCLAPEHADDMHLLRDLHVMIQPPPVDAAGPLPAGALLISSLRPTAPLVMLNVSMGDEAVIGQRDCACPLAQLGWSTHLHSVRSYEKLTGAGMTFLDTDVVRVLEEVLPARFGGGPTDYQLVEEESADGQPSLRLLVHPSVGPVDIALMGDTFLRAVGSQALGGRMMELLWRDAKLLKVERRAPIATGSGKILHLHVERSAGRRPGA
jgi:hypothetical protein